jgi:hypothetical protein
MKKRLIWKSRVSKGTKAIVTGHVRKYYPDAQDVGDAVEYTVDKSCYDIWLLMLCPFKTIQ